MVLQNVGAAQNRRAQHRADRAPERLSRSGADGHGRLWNLLQNVGAAQNRRAQNRREHGSWREPTPRMTVQPASRASLALRSHRVTFHSA